MILPRILIVYTGGTFGMQRAPGQKVALRVSAMRPSVLKRQIFEQVPQIRSIARCEIDTFLNRDSAHMGPDEWSALALRIQSRWRDYDGVVVLHGTDTLSYTASALSFLLKPCRIPIVLTGAQLPLSSPLTDARRNLLSAISVAATGPRPALNQVCIALDDRLLQGNRTRKRSAQEFGAFESPKAEPLAWIGNTIRYTDSITNPHARRRGKVPRLRPAFNRNVLMLKVSPGFPSGLLREALLARLDGIVLSIYASGTGPTHDPEFIGFLRAAAERDIPVILVTESAGPPTTAGGRPEHPSVYEAGRILLREGGIWAGEMTPECAYVKASLVLGQIAGSRRAAAPGAFLAEFLKLWNHDYANEGVSA
jgi:L-asparaginase